MINENEKHELHKAVGDFLGLYMPEGWELILDQACGGHQQIPLFSTSKKSRPNELCKVDILIKKQEQVSVIVEIEETDIKPTQICGKFLTSALASYYIHETKANRPIPMANSVLFVQIVDLISLPGQTEKKAQFENIEQSIRNILPISGSHIDKYNLLCVESSAPEEYKERLKDLVLVHLH
jgi:hypothetical protein